MSAPNQKLTVPSLTNLCNLVRDKNHLSNLDNTSDSYSDILSNKHHIVCSSSDEEAPSPQSSDKDESFDLDPNIYPLCSTPNISLQRVDIDDCCMMDTSPSLQNSSSTNDTSPSLQNSSSTNDTSQTKTDTT